MDAQANRGFVLQRRDQQDQDPLETGFRKTDFGKKLASENLALAKPNLKLA